MLFKGKTAVVTGACQGIGAAIAKELARQGAQVVVNDILQSAATDVVENIRMAGGKALPIMADVTNYAAVDAMMAETVHCFGAVDILVNNAGAVRDNLVLDMPESDWDSIADLCLKGSWFCSKSALGYMKKNQYGRIMNIFSGAWLGNIGHSNYSAVKAGLAGLTRALAMEFVRHNITINAVAPGLIDMPLYTNQREDVQGQLTTNAQPTPYIGQAEDVAKIVAFLGSDNSRYITGQVIHVDGGKSLCCHSE
ncbi:SDR family oxidoreductase [Metallumcola ferriviriculae]|uniref:SDR family oxidoreductase n=1 Tax=Metallumcola ferriviriculae TaxID=3039180 RepID=A0AAU0ULU9_9FIRM|nr:SDR family oxidoreductase [Desulfitibacteraceae bacterium MK1]